MKLRQLIFIFLTVPFSVSATAADLAAKDKAGVEISAVWMKQPIAPKRAEGGRVIFQFGATLPTVVCAPLRLCDIEFQPGEAVKDVRLGDTVRWKVSPATSGPQGASITHAIVKPTEKGLDTTLIITTDRRTYYLRLVSHEKEWMPLVAFEYPEDHEREWKEHIASQAQTYKKQRREIMPSVGMSIKELNFSYEIVGESHWRPVRVFDDGSHTYIDLPREAKYRDAPILLVKDEGGERLVNYRMHGVRFIVDSLFDEAELISGVGSKQQKISIRREG
ncbi:MAG: P-type conjugative transfer protein TrbG [Sedimenticola sp.]